MSTSIPDIVTNPPVFNSEEEKHAEAERLTGLTVGKFIVRYEPNTHIGRHPSIDPGSEGHQFSVSLDSDIDPTEEIWLDSRSNLAVQLVDELRRVAAFYEKAAQEVEEADGMPIGGVQYTDDPDENMNEE